MGLNSKMRRKKLRRINSESSTAAKYDDDQKLAGPSGSLARLWRNVTSELGISWLRFDQFLNAYIRDSRNGVPNNRKSMTDTKGNLVKDYTRPQMTWKVFTKGIKILRAKRLKIIVEITHANDKVTAHSTTLDFGDVSDVLEFERRLEQSEESELINDSATNFPEWQKHDENDPA